MKSALELTKDAQKIQVDIDNILIDSLLKPQFHLSQLIDKNEFIERNPREIYQEEQIRLKRIREQEEKQKILEEQAKFKKIEQERIKAIERAELERIYRKQSFWDGVGLVFLVIGFIGFIILISVLSNNK